MFTKLKNHVQSRPGAYWVDLVVLLLGALLVLIAILFLAIDVFAADIQPITVVRPWWQELVPSVVLIAIILAMYRRIGHLQVNDVKHIHEELEGVRADLKKEFGCLRDDIRDVVAKVDRHVEYHLWVASGGQPPPER